MKINMKIRIAGILLCFVMIFGIMPVNTFAEETHDSEYTDYYGRSAIAKMDNAKALLYVYDKLAEGVEECAETIYVYDGINGISWDELTVVMDAYRRDYAHHFWVGDGYGGSTIGNYVTEVRLQYILSGNELEEARIAFEQNAEEILSGIRDSMSEYEKELYLHDALAKRVEYISTEYAHTAYGALVEGMAVCDGYSEALQYLLQRAGIQSFIVRGTSLNPCSGLPEGHAWNLVRIDGEYYQTDLTWDDQGDYIFHMYFNQNDDIILEDHTIDETGYEIPECNSVSAQYFTGKQEYLDNYTVDSVAKILKDNAFKAHVYVTGSVDDFLNWFTTNIKSIAQKAGINGGFGCGYSYLGKEVVLEMSFDCSHSSLTFVGAKEATCTEDGNSAYYKCFCGKWFSDKSAKNEIADHSSVIIPALGHDYSKVAEDDEYIRTEAADCTEYGTYWYSCSRCGANAKDDKFAADKYYSGTEKGEHKYDSVVTEPTCEEQGYTTHTCSACGESYIDSYTEASGHSFSEWTVAIEPTCTEKGEKHRECENCEYCETVEIDANGHSFGEWYETKAPTEEENGEKRRDCENCDYFETKETTLKPNIIFGDINGDGRVNILDANLVRKFAAKIISLEEAQKTAADVNGDGRINVLDANLIRRFAAKLINIFPVEEE